MFSLISKLSNHCFCCFLRRVLNLNIIFPLSSFGHPDKYLYDIGCRSQILRSFILKFVDDKIVKLNIKNLVTNLGQTANITKVTKIFYIFALI